MTAQFYYEHYYLWGYAAFSSISLVLALFGAAFLVHRRRSFDTVLLATGTLSVIGSRCFSDVGWLILSQGSGTINYWFFGIFGAKDLETPRYIPRIRR